MRNFSKNCNFIEKREVCMRTRLVVSFFICFLLQACSGASTTKTNGVSNTSGNDQAGCIALDTIGIDGAVEKFVWNEEDGIGFLIQDNSYLDFIKSSFTSRPVFAMQAADGRITYSTEDLMKEMWPKERIEDPVSVVAWRPYGYEGENETYIEASAENSGSTLYDKEIRDKPRTRHTKRNV